MATTARAVFSHITKQVEVRAGKACIDHTRIAVADVVALLKAGKTPDEVRIAYPALTLAQIHAAISYYYDNPDEIEATFSEDDAAEAGHDRHRAEFLNSSAGGMRLASDPRFIAIIERARRRFAATGGLSLAQIRRKHRLQPKTSRRRTAPRKARS